MSAKTSKKNSLEAFDVSVRDRAIFEAVQVNCRSQRTVAVEFKLSQPRVSAIVKRVTLWLSQGAPPGLDELPRAPRLRAVSRLHRMRLERWLHEAAEAWQKSDSTTHTIVEKVAKGEVVTRTTKVQTRNRDLRQLKHVADLEDRILAFEGFDELGNVNESSQGRVHEEPQRTPDEDCREVKRRMILGGFDTPGDEGIPGMWGAEMATRNAEVRKQNAEVGNAECGVRSEREAQAWEGEAPAEPPRHTVPESEREGSAGVDLARNTFGGASSNSTSARGNVDCAANDPLPRRLGGSLALPGCVADGAVPAAGALLSPNVTISAQRPQQQSLTSAGNQQIVLSKPEPKPKRYRLMGTAAEMAVSKNYDEFFSLEERIYRATEKARAEQEARARATAMAGQTPHPPLTPTLSPEYRGEGVRST